LTKDLARACFFAILFLNEIQLKEESICKRSKRKEKERKETMEGKLLYIQEDGWVARAKGIVIICEMKGS
jgi:hypothetical protein